MAIQEYSVQDDFFQCDEDTGELGFPCCCCKNKDGSSDEFPCSFCGHNVGALEHYSCSLCGELQSGHPLDGEYIAKDTKAKIGPLCLTCYESIVGAICSS